MTEKEIQQQVLLRLGSRRDCRLFRNNQAQAWVGRLIGRDAARGTLTLADPRPLHAGLHVGSGDLIGWRSLVITPEMVGQTIGQFLSVECKSPTGRVRPEQENWRDVVARAGGLAGIVRSPEEAERLLLKIN